MPMFIQLYCGLVFNIHICYKAVVQIWKSNLNISANYLRTYITNQESKDAIIPVEEIIPFTVYKNITVT
jgi:hypothetical protein